MLFSSLQSSLQLNNTDYFRSFINSFLHQYLNGTYSTGLFSDSFNSFLTQIHHPYQSSLSSFLASWLEQPGFPLITVFPSYTRSQTIKSISFAQKQCILNSDTHIPSHFAISFTMNLTFVDFSSQTIQVSFHQPTKTIMLPPNVTSFIIHLSPYLPAVIRQTSFDPQGQTDPEVTVRELRSQCLLLKKGEGSIKDVLLLFSPNF